MASYSKKSGIQTADHSKNELDDYENEKQTAIEELIKELRQMKELDSASVNKVWKVIKSRKVFGNKGDRILHVLITATTKPFSDERYGASNGNPDGKREGPKKDERRDSFWSDVDTVIKPSESTTANMCLDCYGSGTRLLLCLFKLKVLRRILTNLPEKEHSVDRDLDMFPAHLAMDKNNDEFMSCLLGLFYINVMDKDLQVVVQDALETKGEKGRNVVHGVIYRKIQFAALFAAICSRKALVDEDDTGRTPLHLAMSTGRGGKLSKKRPASITCRGSVHDWKSQFFPIHVLDEIEKRTDVDLGKILQMVNKDGKSMFQDCQGSEEGKSTRKSKEEMHEDDRMTESEDRSDILERLKRLIFDKVQSVAGIQQALYGHSVRAKELSLDMSDFNQRTHNFESFVEKLRKLESNDDADEDYGEGDGAIEFEETLLFVTLPDLNYVKQLCSNQTIQKIFIWLQDRGVRKIKKLRIPDSTTSPLSDAFVQEHILDAFQIEVLDWRRLDVNLDCIMNTAAGELRPNAKALEELRLYSSGNWSVLHHWISQDGLCMLPQARPPPSPPLRPAADKTGQGVAPQGVNRHCRSEPSRGAHMDESKGAESRDADVHLQGLYEKSTKKRHLRMATRYKQQIDKQNRTETSYELTVRDNAHWDYPLPPHKEEMPLVKHQFTNQLLPTNNALERLKELPTPASRGRDSDDTSDDETSGCEAVTAADGRLREAASRFRKYALRPSATGIPGPEDHRIRVALIDNGTDRTQPNIRNRIAAGCSWVTADQQEQQNPELPWWMVSDPHGTQMASLIAQTSAYCRLYVARVGRGRNDIDPDGAAKAIDWAVKHKVDIISLSWTLEGRKNTEGLQEAINRAISSRTLVFCSTPDQGIYEEAGHRLQGVITVSATDRYGHPTPKGSGETDADVYVPGEKVFAPAPAYLGNTPADVSGSSVATALAAGIAALSLLLLYTFNPPHDLHDRADDFSNTQKGLSRGKFHTKQGMLRVFHRLQKGHLGVILSRLFPADAANDDDMLEKLAGMWHLKNWSHQQADT